MTGKVKEAQMLAALVEIRAHLHVLMETAEVRGHQPFHDSMRRLSWTARDLFGVDPAEFDEAAKDLMESWWA